MDMKPLNIFQRCIRVWEESHPYNAAQVLEIAGPPDVTKITETWNAALAASGLGVARVRGGKFRYEKADHQDVAEVDPNVGLERHFTRELNRPFDEGVMGAGGRRRECTMLPFRPFVVRNEGGRSHHLGVIYQHWVADSISMRMLLREWFCRLHDPTGVTGRPVHVPRGGFWRYFGPGRSGWGLIDGALATIGSMSAFARARKLERDPGPQEVEVTLHRLPDGMIETLHQAARRRRVTLNDVFLAALATACDEHGPDPRRSPRDLALGSIVDLRGLSPEPLDDTFSLFLGFTTFVIPADRLRDPDRLLACVARQSAQQKETRAAAVSMLRMGAGYAQGRLLSPARLARFYREYMPLMGGVSNVNMNRAWPGRYHPAPLMDYIRVAPTGPMVPVVIAATTIGKRFTFTLTRRASVVGAARGADLARAFVAELTARAEAG